LERCPVNGEFLTSDLFLARIFITEFECQCDPFSLVLTSLENFNLGSMNLLLTCLLICMFL
jgi:hypothetical protein